MKCFILILLMLLTFNIFAQTIINGTVQNEVAIEGRTSFFFKVYSSGKYISYTLPKDPAKPREPGVNHLLNVDTSLASVIPGPWDPVFVNTANLMVLPHGAANNISYEVHKLDNLILQNSDSMV